MLEAEDQTVVHVRVTTVMRKFLEEIDDDTSGDIDIGCDCTKHGTIAEQLIETLVRNKVSHRKHIPVSQHYWWLSFMPFLVSVRLYHTRISLHIVQVKWQCFQSSVV